MISAITHTLQKFLLLKEKLYHERVPCERWKFDWTPPQKCPSDAQKRCYNQTNTCSTTYNIWKVSFASQIANSRNYINSFRFLEGRQERGDCEIVQTSPHCNFSFTMRKKPSSHLEVRNFDWRPLQNMPSDAHKCLSHQRKMLPTIYTSCHSSFAHQRANLTSHIKLSLLKLTCGERFKWFLTYALSISKMQYSSASSEFHSQGLPPHFLHTPQTLSWSTRFSSTDLLKNCLLTHRNIPLVKWRGVPSIIYRGRGVLPLIRQIWFCI